MSLRDAILNFLTEPVDVSMGLLLVDIVFIFLMAYLFADTVYSAFEKGAAVPLSTKIRLWFTKGDEEYSKFMCKTLTKRLRETSEELKDVKRELVNYRKMDSYWMERNEELKKEIKEHQKKITHLERFITEVYNVGEVDMDLVRAVGEYSLMSDFEKTLFRYNLEERLKERVKMTAVPPTEQTVGKPAEDGDRIEPGR